MAKQPTQAQLNRLDYLLTLEKRRELTQVEIKELNDLWDKLFC